MKGDIEKELEETYSQMLSQLPTGMTLEHARSEVKKAIELCKEQAIKEGTNVLPDNYGDLLIQAAESGEPKAKKIVDTAHKEGATDEDIREFWNLNDLQRRIVLWSENIHRVAMASSLLKPLWESGNLSKDAEEKVAAKVRKTFPMYGDPDNTRVTSGDNRPLPHELRGRIDRWRIKLITEQGEQMIKEKLNSYSTFNAFVRDEIRKGSL
jgi:predicted RNase H-like HicB family nuclease